MTARATAARRGRPPAASRDDVVAVALSQLPPRRAHRRAGDRRRARPRPHDDLPLVRLARRADRRRRRPGGRAALRRGAGGRAWPRRRRAPRHVRPHQPWPRGRARATELPRARARRAANPHLERGPRSAAHGRDDPEPTSRRRCDGGSNRPSIPRRWPTPSCGSRRRSSTTTRRQRSAGDVERLREIEAALLGVSPTSGARPAIR